MSRTVTVAATQMACSWDRQANLATAEKLVRDVVNGIGYDRGKKGFDGSTCGVLVALANQSADISRGVDQNGVKEAIEYNDAFIEAGGAGDQGMMFGYATNETKEYMPMTLVFSHNLVKKLADIRKKQPKLMPYLRPDSKSQVTIEYGNDNKPKRVEAVVVSTQHDAYVTQKRIREDVIKNVIKKVIPAKLLDKNTKIHVNPTGKFEIGGPHGDSGLTGRTIIVDTYGGKAPHGGGAFSGKDPSKVDRSAAYASRHIAKNIVAAKLADECLIQLSYAIGVAQPVSIFVNTFGTGKISDEKLANIIRKNIDLTPAGIIRRLNLRRPVYRNTAAYGHFGRNENGFTWEKLDLIQKLKKLIK